MHVLLLIARLGAGRVALEESTRDAAKTFKLFGAMSSESAVRFVEPIAFEVKVDPLLK